MAVTLDPRVYRFASRDIILVYLEDGALRPMYRSTGHNSGMPGTWLPFDGIKYRGSWFDKTMYCTPVALPEFQRFGDQATKDLSELLSTMDISEGMDASFEEINRLLSYID